MTETRALIWKSYRELRRMVLGLLGGLLVVSILTDLSTSGNSRGFTSESPSGFVATLGVAIAILLATALTSKDLKGSLLIFWESRGVSPTRFIISKYISGLLGLMLIIVPLLWFEMIFGSNDGTFHGILGSFAARVLSYSIFTFALIYSASFAIGCVNRNAVPTALLSLAATLLIYFAPLVIRGLGFLNTMRWFQDDTFKLLPLYRGYLSTVDYFFIKVGTTGLYIHKGFPAFCVSSLLLCTALLVLSMKAVANGWRWEAHQRTTCWSLAAVILVLFTGASAQIGSDMKVEKIEPLGGARKITSLVPAGDLLLGQVSPEDHHVDLEIVFIDPNAEKMRLGSLVKVSEKAQRDRMYRNLLFARNRLSRPLTVTESPTPRAYTFLDELEQDMDKIERGWFNFKQTKLELITLDASPLEGRADLESRILSRTDLAQYVDVIGERGRTHYLGKSYPSFPSMSLVRDRLLVKMADSKGAVLLVFDVSNPEEPKHIETRHGFNSHFFLNRYSTGGPSECMFRQLPGLTPEESLEVFAKSGIDLTAMEGDLMVIRNRQHMTIDSYRLLGIDDVSDRYAPQDRDAEMPHLNARFERLDQYRIPIIFRILGEGSNGILLKDGLFYDKTSNMSKSLLVYDLREPSSIRRIGHFTSPEEIARIGVAPLDDGRVVVGSGKITVLKPPRM